MDRGYTDYALFHAWTQRGVVFVTRLRDNAVYEVVQELRPPDRSAIVADQLIRLSSDYAQARCLSVLRRIVVRDTAGEEIALLTNHLTLGATTVAAIYRDRWEIEIFFRTLKQHLRIKTFVGTSANALTIQIWTALLALLLVAILRFRSTFGWHLSRLIALLRVNLFTHRDLWDWLNDPFHTPPLEPPQQLTLTF
jgi:IS4 transposase